MMMMMMMMMMMVISWSCDEDLRSLGEGLGVKKDRAEDGEEGVERWLGG